tara:strand:+ start:107 stop:820 length:714 start_codon:yes stop_codon:yes gene_type:complete
MIRKTQKQFTGLKSELIPTLPYGSQFIAIDTEELFVYDEESLPRLVKADSNSVKEDIQGYIGLLSAVYFDGAATSSEIPIEQVDIWQDVVMTIHPNGVSDKRVDVMEAAQASGFSGTGEAGNPIRFLLEGLVEESAATLRTSLTFIPDEDGGRLDSRIFLERHSAASPSEDFPINAAGLSMESGADEEYPHLVSVQFFVGDTINTNGVGDAGKIRFQIKSDVAGTVLMNEMALFIQL